MDILHDASVIGAYGIGVIVGFKILLDWFGARRLPNGDNGKAHDRIMKRLDDINARVETIDRTVGILKDRSDHAE